MADNKIYDVMGPLGSPLYLGDPTKSLSRIESMKVVSTKKVVPGDLVKVTVKQDNQAIEVEKVTAVTDVVYGCVVRGVQDRVDECVSIMIKGTIIGNLPSIYTDSKVGKPLQHGAAGAKCCCKVSILKKMRIALKQDGSEEKSNAYELLLH